MKRLICLLRGHRWKEDRPLSLAGLFAAAGLPLWVPPATCRRCGKKNEPINHERVAESNGWYAKLPEQERVK